MIDGKLVNTMTEHKDYRDLTEWSIARGLKFDGIAPHRFPGKGLGIVAQRSFRVSD